ncbi:unnamed protein product [Thlaspi arvense]|uniref:Uncharacterized protein n=1 Tax=Thlaspi arvense TaxID=13288 RepID=A0AAU9RX58_THLAR|nr:unnamed protein product [Thlaspi arvense]
MLIRIIMGQPHALLVASPGIGHLIPILELGNRISSVLNVHVTILAVTAGSFSPTETRAIEAAVDRGTCEITELPSVDVDHLVEPDATVITKIVEMMRATKPAIRDAVKSMNRKPTVMIVDFFGTGLMNVAEDVGVRAKYVYVPSHAWFLAVMVYLPVLDKVVEGEYIDIKEPMQIPGCRPVGPEELMETMLDRSDRKYRDCVQRGEDIPMSDGVLVNTWEELQENTLAALREVGELRRSGGTLSIEQTKELANGLELSGQKFLWVLRRPISYLGASSSDGDIISAGLPEGFLNRTRGVGLVVTQWAPQVEILGHRSIGGFLSHCGWSSVLESLTKGVPIVAWPLYAEQWMNATLLTEEMGVAIRTSELPSKRVIGREEVASLVRKIVAEEDEEGQKIRDKAEEARVSSERAWAQGGSSHSSLFEWAKGCGLIMDQPHALLVASPGLGHLIPILELGNRLSSVLNVQVTILAVTAGSSSPIETTAIQAAVAKDHLVEPDAKVVTKIVVKMRAMKPALRDAVKSMNRKPTVMIVDFFGTGLMSVAEDVGVRDKYVYIPSQAWFLALMVYLPVLDKVVEGEYVDIKEPMKIPGCRPVGPDELMDPMLDRSNRQYRECVQCGEEISMSDGVLVNTWEELQGNTLAALRKAEELGRVIRVPVYPIGPIVRTRSGGTLSLEQTMELACGLELSGQKFLWVLRRPNSYLGSSSSDDDLVSTCLPEGFLDRTRGVGLVVTQWAPQVEILSHGSIGGFLSHCGWSSALESLTKGVPIVAWPLYAEQWMNATLLTEEIGVAIRTSELPAKRVIGREEVASLVRKIVAEEDEEGQKIRDKAEQVRVSSERAWAQGGSSHSSLFEWAKGCSLVSCAPLD